MADRLSRRGRADVAKPAVFRFYFPKFLGGYTATAVHFGEAYAEVSHFLTLSGITDPGPVEIFINDQPTSMPAAA